MRTVCWLALAAFVGGVASLALMASPASATLPAEEPDNTGMVNGNVRAIVQAGGRTWVAGTFTQMMDANGNNVRAVNNLAAFNASTGAPDLAVNIPSVTKTSGTTVVYDMSLGPDGKLYIGGAFDKVNGVNRKNVAAFDPSTGALASFSATPANATAILATSDAVYVGTSKLVKLTLSGADAPGYNPPVVQTDPSLRAHTTNPQFRDIVQVGPSTLVTACQCDSLDDGSGFQDVKAVVKIDAGTGDLVNWTPSGLGPTSAAFGISAFVRDFPSASDRTVYLGAGGSDFTAAYDYESGAQRWKTDTSGSTQVVAWHQNTVIAGGHFQWVPKTNGQQCSDNANPNTSCWHAPRLVAMDPTDGDVLLQSGEPWNPGICCRYNGVWALWVDQDGGKLHVGGEFTKVGGTWSGSGTTWNLNGAQNQDFYTRLFAPATGVQTLAVSKTGTGTVTSSPAGINCGATCSTTYGTNTSVTLTAAPGVGQMFVGWGGDCTGTSTTCSLTMSTSRNVVANFAPISYTLTVTKAGSGNGGVTSDVGGINCGSTCSASYSGGAVVTLTAAQNSGSVLAGWSGGGCTGTGTCQVTMNAATNVTATFAPAKNLNLTKTGSGTGTVTSSPAASINCSTACTSQTGQFSDGSTVTLTASAAPGSIFTGWSGDCSGTSTTCSVTMTAQRNVTANFELLRTLSVSLDGPGTGTVTSNVGGIDCGTTCSASYANGTMVTLTATVGSNSTFTGWTGAGCSGTGTCVVTMSSAQSVTASFGQITYPVTVTSNGSGTVSSAPSGVSCPSTCTHSFVQGTNVTLTATPDANYSFSGWSGTDCSGVLTTCSFTVNAARSATATFTQITHTLTISDDGQGSGHITSDPAGISCPSTCSEVYMQPQVVTLTADPDPGADFAGWSYGTCGSSLTCAVTMDADHTVTATYSVPLMLDVTLTGSGTGSVTSDVPGIDCPAVDCDDSFPSDSTVTLTATPDADMTFTGWSGAGCSGTGTCVVTMDTAHSVTAGFDQINHALTVDVTPGQGSGSVTSDVAGIECPATTCSASYAQPTVVTLTAVADSGSDFAGWSYGSCGSSLTCAVTMDQARNVTATFTIPYALGVTVVGDGSVTADTGSIDCPAVDCDDTFPSDSTVTLTADPDPNRSFTGWTGDCTGTDLECVVDMDTAQNVTATFTAITHQLTVTPGGQGSGLVTSDVGTISCPTTCSNTYTQPQVVTLTAVADSGSTFTGWSGAGCSGTGTCVVTMNQARTVTATYTIPYALGVTVVGDGSVTSAPGSIDCPGTCSDTFPSDTSVTLTATPDADRVFTGWSGAGCSGTGTCTVTMDTAKSVTATFSSITHTLTVTTAGPGSGVVTSDVGTISCPTTCSNTYTQPQVVTLTAVADSGSTFTGWSGAGCSGTGTCVVTMNQARTVTATYNLTSGCGRILFTSTRSGNPDVWVMDANGANETNLTNRSGSDTDPVWSPDCSKIAFTSTRSGNVDIYVMNANGTGTTRLTTHASPDTEPTWSPDSSKIAFVSTRTGNGEVFVMNANGSNQVNETNHSANDTSPDWSPDGTTIAFDSTRGGGLNIWTMTSTGGSPTKRTTGLGSAQAPAWSPSGAKIAFVSNSTGGNQIWLMNANGSSPARLTNDAGVHADPTWSPDGANLAYASTQSGRNQIWVVNQNGSGATNTSTSTSPDTLPNWSA